jgi:hypothetical protein
MSDAVRDMGAARAAPGMHVEWIDTEAVVLDPETGHLHYLNASAALVYALILEHGVQGAVDELKRLRGEEANLGDQVADLVDDMVEKGLLIRD